MDLFEKTLSVSIEDIEFELRRYKRIPWLDFFLNPRRLRGSDFLMRWSQGVWSEHRIIEAVNDTSEYVAFPYGPSSVAPDDDVKAVERYFEKLEKAGLDELKRPDVLIFRKSEEGSVREAIRQLGGEQELPFTPEDNQLMQGLISKAIIAVECENSLWKVSQMPDYGKELKPMKRLGGKLGLPKGSVVPTVILKEEDIDHLQKWQNKASVPIHIWHVFYDKAYGIAFDQVKKLIKSKMIEPTKQTFQAPGGATTTKMIFKVYYHYAYQLAEATEDPKLVADRIIDKNGHILPYVRFEGGVLKMNPKALVELRTLTKR